MFTKTLSQNAAGALALLGKSNILKDAYLIFWLNGYFVKTPSHIRCGNSIDVSLTIRVEVSIQHVVFVGKPRLFV